MRGRPGVPQVAPTSTLALWQTVTDGLNPHANPDLHVFKSACGARDLLDAPNAQDRVWSS
jgi:hypothetical protein